MRTIYQGPDETETRAEAKAEDVVVRNRRIQMPLFGKRQVAHTEICSGHNPHRYHARKAHTLSKRPLSHPVVPQNRGRDELYSG